MRSRGTDRRDREGTAGLSAAYREAVLEVVASIPTGRVMAYSAIADYLAEAWQVRSPRLIGRIMAGCNGELPWHRVVQASGAAARGHEAEALRRLRREGTPLRGARVAMRTAAWAPVVPPPRP
ncbi:MAG: cysteine methyltransferase [Chloroflexi bacterium]|nr:cysteine methyltransferase [Chloroflexota bacterium]